MFITKYETFERVNLFGKYKYDALLLVGVSVQSSGIIHIYPWKAVWRIAENISGSAEIFFSKIISVKNGLEIHNLNIFMIQNQIGTLEVVLILLLLFEVLLLLQSIHAL